MSRALSALGMCLLAVGSLALVGCNAETASSGVAEPLRVNNGQFWEGSFPVSNETGPAVSQVMLRNTEFLPGTVGKAITGNAGTTAQTIALALENLGGGYWLVPVGAEDPLLPGTYTWAANADFARELPSGFQTLLLAAADGDGNFGPVTTQRLNIKSILPTGKVVASLTWGVDADLDLHLISPSGKELFSKRPNSIESDEFGAPVPGSGLLDRDSLAVCIPDGTRTENVVWADAPEPGTYTVRVDMFSACKQPAASFKFSLFVDGKSVLERNGRLLDIDADGGGAGSGLYVTEFNCDEGTGTCS